MLQDDCGMTITQSLKFFESIKLFYDKTTPAIWVGGVVVVVAMMVTVTAVMAEQDKVYYDNNTYYQL